MRAVIRMEPQEGPTQVLLSMPDVMTQIAGNRSLSQYVAAHARDHGSLLLLPEGVPVLHWTVADRTFHAGVQVFLVAEGDKIWEAI